ncbi:TonB-dependent receptor domain-containing protein [Kordiimonas gwangyangensis]|uniref:TonB-dependent receptor domain-containing protein n=1 Tax=Kordiimonas gwangyangensis TaxID=288022 RepID=UPI0003A08764|nr:TonB-dependent receptor [Kordiimonas gwangyangensis]
MSKELKKLRRTALMGSAATLLASFALGAGVTGASAQDADTTEEFDLEEVVVTGSRIVRKDFTSASPISVTSSADIQLSGFTRVEDMMNSLPQIEAAQTSFISNGASGTATLDLRGMGTQRTLVLVNGRRLQPGGLSQAPDINQIPAALVERAEVITGGASATYGADAVAGVVNFVMKDDFEGIEINAGISGYQHNNRNDYIQGLMDAKGFEYPEGSNGIDGVAYNVDVVMGGEFADGNGHATVYATWRKVEEFLQADRDYSSCALSGSGTSCGGSGNAEVPNFYLGGFNDIDFANRWTLDSNSNFVDGSSNVYNYAPVNHFMRPDERWTFGAFIDYEINEHARPYMEVSFMRDRTDAQIAESGTFFAEQYNLPYESGLLNDAQRAWLTSEYGVQPGEQFSVYIGKRNTEGGPRANIINHNAFRIVTGVAGDITDTWSYDASVQYGSTSFSSTYVNDFFGPNILTALEDEAYDVFTYQGITPEQAAGLTGTAILEGITKEYIFNAYVTGDLGATFPGAEDTIQAVLGVEYRKEVFDLNADTVYEEGQLLGQGGPTPSVSGSYNVKEIFGELIVPLPAAFELELGGRYSDYNTSGGAETYKVALSWNPIDEIKFVGSYNRAVRAANVNELFSPQSRGLWGGVDPCAGTTPELTAAQCANTGVTAAQYGNITLSPASQYNGNFGGNPDLAPEKADSWTFGVIANPVAGLQMRVDFWDITLNDAIANIDPEIAVRQCGLTGQAEFCSLVNRGNGGSLWLGNTGYVTGTLINTGGQHLQGIDVAADYVTDLGAGTLGAKIQGTYMLKKEVDPVGGLEDDEYDCVDDYTSNGCFAQPVWRHTMTVSFTPDSFWSVSAKWRYFGSVGGLDNGGVDDHIAAQSYFDLKASFDVNENVGFLVGVNNIFDKEPPLVGGNFSTNANTFAGYYDTLGRYLHANVQVKF